MSSDAYLTKPGGRAGRVIIPERQKAVNAAREAASTAGKHLGPLLAHSAKYKTTRCNNLVESHARACKYRGQCLFTHGEHDFRRDPLTHYYEP